MGAAPSHRGGILQLLLVFLPRYRQISAEFLQQTVMQNAFDNTRDGEDATDNRAHGREKFQERASLFRDEHLEWHHIEVEEDAGQISAGDGRQRHRVLGRAELICGREYPAHAPMHGRHHLDEVLELHGCVILPHKIVQRVDGISLESRYFRAEAQMPYSVTRVEVDVLERRQVVNVHIAIRETPARRKVHVPGHLVHLQRPEYIASFTGFSRNEHFLAFLDALLDGFRVEDPAFLLVRESHRIAVIATHITRRCAITRSTVARCTPPSSQLIGRHRIRANSTRVVTDLRHLLDALLCRSGIDWIAGIVNSSFVNRMFDIHELVISTHIHHIEGHRSTCQMVEIDVD